MSEYQVFYKGPAAEARALSWVGTATVEEVRATVRAAAPAAVVAVAMAAAWEDAED